MKTPVTLTALICLMAQFLTVTVHAVDEDGDLTPSVLSPVFLPRQPPGVPTSPIIAPAVSPIIVSPVVAPVVAPVNPPIIVGPSIVAPSIIGPSIVAPVISPVISPVKPPVDPPVNPPVDPPVNPPVNPPVTNPTPPPPEIKNSHLACHRALVEDPPTLNLFLWLKANELQKEYNLDRCRPVTKAVDLCVPATKEVKIGELNFPDIISGDEYTPQVLRNDFICYTLICKEFKPRKQMVADQFGIKKLTILKKKQRLCVPAWKLDSDGKPIILEV